MKKKLSIILAVTLTVILLLTFVTFAVGWSWPAWPTNKLDNMNAYCLCGESGNPCCCCGPSSGVSIGQYYRNRADNPYPNLPGGTWIEENAMYDHLYARMETGFWYWPCLTGPYNYGPGFVLMTEDYRYTNFSHEFDHQINDVDADNDGFDDDFEDIMEAIDNGWPIALEGNFKYVDDLWGDESDDRRWPPKKSHYIAIKGYSYMLYNGATSNHYIICTDSYSGSSNLVILWDELITDGLHLRAITIKDS